MTETEMQLKLGKHFGIQYICIPNVLMTGEYRKEVSPLTDIQIKDFMRIGCMKWFKEW